MVVNYLKTIALVLVVCLVGCRPANEPEVEISPPLADSLLVAYRQVRQAAATGEPDSLIPLLAPRLAGEISGQISCRSQESARALIRHSFNRLPDTDTLAYDSLVAAYDYARLALRGDGSGWRRDARGVSYTFLLFRRDGDRWQLAGVSSLEKARNGRSGADIIILETELPPEMRFPRMF